jgi:hypothetical protein
MTGLRRHLIAIALATISVHAGTLTAGALRVCWGNEHRHAGAAAQDCAMHHHASVPAPNGHHGHGSAHPSSERALIACNCTDDADSPYIAPNALVAVRVSLAAPIEVYTLSPEHGRSVSDIELTPLLPPPRSAFS